MLPQSSWRVHRCCGWSAFAVDNLTVGKLVIDREMFSGSVDAGFVLALSFHHGDLEPDCVGASTRGLMRGMKIPPHNIELKMQGGRICVTLRYMGCYRVPLKSIHANSFCLFCEETCSVSTAR